MIAYVIPHASSLHFRIRQQKPVIPVLLAVMLALIRRNVLFARVGPTYKLTISVTKTARQDSSRMVQPESAMPVEVNAPPASVWTTAQAVPRVSS